MLLEALVFYLARPCSKLTSYCYSACVRVHAYMAVYWLCEAINIYSVYLCVLLHINPPPPVTIAWPSSRLMADYPPLAFKCRLQDRRLSCLDMPHIELADWLFTAALAFNCSSNYWLNDKTWEIERDIWIRTVAIKSLPLWFCIHGDY